MVATGTHPGERSLAALPTAAVRSFLEAFDGDLIRPSDEEYDDARAVWNGMIDSYPAIVARCGGVNDVVTAVAFAREQGLPLSVRGGGHNVAGTAVRDGGLVIDLSALSGVDVDPTARIARVEGGATLGDVDHETQRFGLATALGVVSATGVAGLTLNGGYGHLSRQHGLALDNLTGVEVVTADGRVRRASEDENEDLFWAVRGGGGAVGVVTAFEFDLHEVGPEVYALFAWFQGDDATAAMDRFREWADDAPREADVLPFVAHVPDLEEFPEDAWGEPALAFFGSYRGDIEDAEAVFEPLYGNATPVSDFSGPMAYVDVQSMLDEDFPDGHRYCWKSTFLEELTDEVVDLMVRYNESAPSALSTVDCWHLGDAIADVPRDATAFWHREPQFMLNFEANWVDERDDDANVIWVREGIDEAGELAVASGRYGNFPGLNEDPGTALFGENYDRMVDVKTAYDPENVFRANGAVTPRTD